MPAFMVSGMTSGRLAKGRIAAQSDARPAVARSSWPGCGSAVATHELHAAPTLGPHLQRSSQSGSAMFATLGKLWGRPSRDHGWPAAVAQGFTATPAGNACSRTDACSRPEGQPLSLNHSVGHTQAHTRKLE